MQKSLLRSRREFIKSVGTLTTAAAATGMMATAAYGNEAAASIDEIVWDEEFDIVVVGAGAAGLSTALTVATEGHGESCLLIEKETNPAGCSAVSGGRCIWTDDADLFHTYMVGLFDGEPTTPDDILVAFAQGAAENLNWILSLNPIVEEMTIEEPGSPSISQPNCYPEYPEVEGSLSVGSLRVGKRTDGGEVTGPTHIALFLREKVEEYADAIDFRLSAAMTALIQNPDTKEIEGLIVETDGQGKYIKANIGVVMCCGGFESNPEMIWNYFCQKNAVSEARPRGNTGDGHKICQKLGAAFWHMNSIAGFWPEGRTNDGQYVVKTNRQYGIVVGTNGRRFFMDLGSGVAGPSYPVTNDLGLDVNVRHGHQNFGGEWPHLPLPSKMWFICDADGFAAGAYANTADPVAEGAGYMADTLEDLAAQIGVPANELLKTAEVWNGYCATGEDLSFYRPASYMVNAALKTPPFYATQCAPIFLNTDGGPVRNVHGQILDVEGDPIPKLYASGEFGSIWTNMYQGACNIGEGMIFGRIAVRHMLGLEPKVYETVYVSNKVVGTPVDGPADIQAALGISLDVPEGATNAEYSIYEDNAVAEVTFSFKDNTFTQRAKATGAFEDVADSASVDAKEAAWGDVAYEINYTKPAAGLVATYTVWYDQANGTSRALIARTSQDDGSLTSLTELLIDLY